MNVHDATTSTSAQPDAFLPDAVLLAPTAPQAVPMRAPAEAWGLVVVAVRTTAVAGAPIRFTGGRPRT